MDVDVSHEGWPDQEWSDSGNGSATNWEEFLSKTFIPASNKASVITNGIRDGYGDAYQFALPVQERLHRGQYFTPDPVCDLMLAWAIRTGQETILDAGCGTGAFLLRAYDLIQTHGASNHAAILQQLHGIDIDPNSVAIAAYQLMNLSSEKSAPLILTGDFLDPNLLTEASFDIIIGNPPYVRAEHWKQSKNAQAGLQQTDTEVFKEKFRNYLSQYPQQKKLFRAKDLYLSFLIRATLLLKPGGRLAYITSNSWLSTESGKAFAHFLNHHYRIHFLMESSVERWFSQAAINPVILALERKKDSEKIQPGIETTAAQKVQRPEKTDAEFLAVPHQIQWIRFKTPLQKWLPNANEPHYWQHLRSQLNHLPQSNNLISHQLFLQSEIFDEANPISLPFYFRASQDFSDLLRQRHFWTRLDSLGSVRYPIKTGINQFFYLTRAQAVLRGIEPDFLMPVIKSSRHIKRYEVSTEDTDYFLFSCGLSKQALQAEGYTGALAYIEWGETQTSAPRQKRQSPVLWPEIPSVQGRPHWYFIPPIPPAHLLCSRFFDTRFFFPHCQGTLLEDQTFYGLTLHPSAERTDIQLMAALLNSTLSYALVELNGRTSLGEGVLQYSRKDMAALPVLDPILFTEPEKQALIELYQAMAKRPILTIQEEMLQSDRQALDRLILQKITPEPERWQALVRAELIDRVNERRSLARSVKKRRGQKNSQ